MALVIAVACTGCTTTSLAYHTLNQIKSEGNCRDQEVLNCLAAVAANPSALPSFALYAEGLTQVQDEAILSSITSWTRAAGSFALETLGVTVTRNPHGEWTVDSVVEYERLEAMRCACLWAIYGPERACKDNPEILGDPQQYYTNKPHFGVADRLARMPAGWLGIGRRQDVPSCAHYKAHCGGTWIWVTPGGTEGLAQFTLVLHDIATLDYPILYGPLLLVTLTRDDVTKLPDLTQDPEKKR